VIIMADLTPLGAVFSEPVDALKPDLAAKALAMIGRYQAESWMNPLIRDDAYLQSGGALSVGDMAGWMFSPENWAEQSARPRFKAVPPLLRDPARWRKAHQALIDNWWHKGPYCLSHGDAHVGQSYSLPDGQVRLLDWQCVMAASWGHDFANFLVSALEPDDRRQCEGDLLKAHLEILRDHGVAAPDMDTAWRIYRACAFYGAAWALCKVEMQSEENCTAIAARHHAAVADLKSLEVLEVPAPVAA
jgi:Phosphotransferase enzyme family